MQAQNQGGYQQQPQQQGGYQQQPPPQQGGYQQQPQQQQYQQQPASDGIYANPVKEQDASLLGGAAPVGGTPLPANQAYEIRNGRPVVFNAYGFQRAEPFFSRWDTALNGIRGYGIGYWCCESCQCQPGPNIPAHWWDAGSGWVTNYFTNVQAYDPNEKIKGTFQCKVPNPSNGAPCDFTVENSECCGGPCWCAGTSAPNMMKAHLVSAHGFVDPPKRGWATKMCCWEDQGTEGCGDVLFCTPCVGSRQLMAIKGHTDRFNVWWCIYFVLAGIQSNQKEGGEGGGGGGDNNGVVYIPPCQLAAIWTRCQVVSLQNIDEGRCSTMCRSYCCSCCSLAQTYRELSGAGVWPGGTCCSKEPPVVQMKAPGQIE